MSEQKTGGYRFDKEDRAYLLDTQMRSDAYKTAMSIPFSRPKKIDPRKYAPVRNQATEGACQGFALRAAGGNCFLNKTGEWKEFSPDAAYYLTQKKDGIRGDNGSTVAGGAWVATQLGFLPEEHMPYSDRYNPGDLPDNHVKLMEPFKVQNHKVLTSYSEVVEWLGRRFGGVWYGCRWGVQIDANGFMNWSASGGGHSNALMGYDGPESSDGLPQFLWNLNSWSKQWGLGGWSKWNRSEFEQMIRDSNSVVIGISDMEDVEPRESKWANDNPL